MNLRSTRLEILENRTLFDIILPSDFGAVPNDGKDDRAAIPAAIDASNRGDAVRFGEGTFDVHGTLTLRSGRQYLGVAGSDDDAIGIENLPQFLMPRTTLNFTIDSGFGMKTEKDGHDIRIAYFDINSTRGAIGVLDGQSKNINVNHNAISAHGGHAVQMNYLRGLKLADNFFHDSDGADRSFESWDVGHANLDRNIVYRANQGFHMYESKEDVNLRFNVFRKVRRMGLEIQGYHPTKDMTVEQNVFFDAMEPNWNTFAISVPANNTINTRIINNYLRSDFTGDWGNTGEKRFGYAVEAGGNGNGDAGKRVRIAGNIMGGPNPWFNYVVSTTQGAIVENNECYGPAMLGDFAGEPGDKGFGGVDVRENKMVRDWRDMPPLPQWVDRGSIPGSPAIEEEQREIKPAHQREDLPSGTFLSDMQWQEAKSGWGPVEINSSNGGKHAGDGKTISLDGEKHDKGLGVAIDSTIVYDLNGKYSTFFSDLGIDDHAGKKGSMTFEVWGDDRKLFDSGVLKGHGKNHSTELDVKGVKKLKLVTTNGGDGDNSDLGVWASAQVS